MSNIKKLPDKHHLNYIFKYDEETGKLYWKVSSSPKIKVGQEAGTPHKTKYGFTGYRQVGIDGSIYLVHRIIWAMNIGDIPVGLEVDHLDRDRTNNRLTNFVLVSHTENMKNSKGRKGTILTEVPKSNVTGELYIHFCNSHKRYKVIYPRGAYQGSFRTLKDAIIKRNEVLHSYGREF